MSDTKTVLITGATSGIGEATAYYLHCQGYKLVLVGRNEQKIKSLSANLDNEEYIVFDLKNTDRIGEIFEHCKDRNIMLDGLVHAAGYVKDMPIRMMKLEHAEGQMRVHYYAFLELCKCFYSKKVSNEGASIVAMSSLATATRLKGSVMYSASKSALNTAVSIAAKEFTKRCIRVNALMPAYVNTRMNEGLEELIDLKAQQPFGFIPPDNIAELIEFLLSDRARFITGALIPVSAGMEF